MLGQPNAGQANSLFGDTGTSFVCHSPTPQNPRQQVGLPVPRPPPWIAAYPPRATGIPASTTNPPPQTSKINNRYSFQAEPQIAEHGLLIFEGGVRGRRELPRWTSLFLECLTAAAKGLAALGQPNARQANSLFGDTGTSFVCHQFVCHSPTPQNPRQQVGLPVPRPPPQVATHPPRATGIPASTTNPPPQPQKSTILVQQSIFLIDR